MLRCSIVHTLEQLGTFYIFLGELYVEVFISNLPQTILKSLWNRLYLLTNPKVPGSSSIIVIFRVAVLFSSRKSPSLVSSTKVLSLLLTALPGSLIDSKNKIWAPMFLISSIWHSDNKYSYIHGTRSNLLGAHKLHSPVSCLPRSTKQHQILLYGFLQPLPAVYNASGSSWTRTL